MCGRYFPRSDKQRIAEAFAAWGGGDFILPEACYNVAPSTFQPVIRLGRETHEREMALMRWGLVPHFAKSLEAFKGFSTINARAESVETSATWRVPFARRRCLVPADGFYEWALLAPEAHDGTESGKPAVVETKKKQGKPAKQPYAFAMKDGRPFAFAGLWDAWKSERGDWLQSFSIVTTEGNEVMAGVHDRMPVIVQARDYERWLSRDEEQRPPVDLLRPYPAEEMRRWEAHKDVGNVRNDSVALLNSQ